MIGFRGAVGFLKATARKRYIIILIILGCGLISQANGQATQQATPPKALSSSSPGKLIEIDKTSILIPDVEVFNHQGKQVRFYTDLIKDKVVLLSFFYTSCTYVCTMQGENLSKVQAQLGARLGKDVFLISISMDPKTDTPQKLRYWARAFGARPGWTLVSSDSIEMNRMLKALTGNSPGPKEMHSSVVFIGNDRTGIWTATDGLSEPDGLVRLLDRLTNSAATKQSN